MNVLEINSLQKSFDGRTVLRDISPVSYTHLTLPTILLV